jgi:signal transduction histidine kinase/CheY-like chemotaxis protein
MHDGLERLSLELLLTCDREGRCVEADRRASSVLGIVTGASLGAYAAAGSEEKLTALLTRARSEPVRDWEVCLVTAGGAPATFTFDTEPIAHGFVLLGHRVPPSGEMAIQSYQGAMADLAAMHRETTQQKHDLARLNAQLSESNRGLLSLHAELDEKNDTLRRSADVKTRLVSNVSHEFRTPINSILGLTRLLLDRMDGPLNDEQETQISFIRSNAEALRALIDDLLDLSKIEAGKVALRSRDFAASELLAALRGTTRPLPRSEGVELIVEEPHPDPMLKTDEGKLGQILRNLVSNALKFTERGEVRVRTVAEGDEVKFSVSDTGVGIDPQHLDRVFEEFAQIDGALQRKWKGTGLGLSVSRRLADMLGGTITVRSAVGVGSTFTLTVPRVHVEVAQMDQIVKRSETLDPERAPILVVEDDRQTMFLYEKYLSQSGFQVIPARTTEEAKRALRRVKPAAIVLDVMLEVESSWQFLADVKEDPETRDIPVMVVTVVDRSQKARALGADEFWLKPVDPERMRKKLIELSRRGPVSVLVIDDDESSRYILRKLLASTPYTILEASNAADGVALAREKLPQIILLDFVLGDETAFDVIDELKAHPGTRSIPIIIQTAKTLERVEQERLARDASAVLSKQSLSRELAIVRIREALQKSTSNDGDARG